MSDRPLSERLFAGDRTVRRLRTEIASAAGREFGASWVSGTPVLWARSPWRRVVDGLGRAPLVVAPGPLLSPYDSLRTGLSSLRLSYRGHPFGGADLPDAFGDRLRALRLAGRNRFPPSGPEMHGLGSDGSSKPSLVLIDGGTAASPRAANAFIRDVLARYPDRRFVAAGPDGCPPGPASSALVRLVDPVDPWWLFERVARVHVARAEAGSEAGLAGLEVVCAQERLADDPSSPYGDGVHYFDPWTRRPIPAGEALEHVAWLRDRFHGTGARSVLVGISGWKRQAIDVFADGPHGRPIHTMTAEDAMAAAKRCGGRVQVQAWATRMPERLAPLCAEAGLPLSRIEDGFLRSVGLGASLQPGASIVVDDLGIYYDPRTESRLARLLKETAFAPDLVARAGALRRAIVARRLSKYNVGLTERAEDWPTERRIVLVPGQVEDDASVMHGSPSVRTNLGLLRAARARHPGAFLLYKPHPDVEAGFRPGTIPEADILSVADRIVGGLAIVDLLDRVHHVETMTSLAGFEALIRGLSVGVHGRPFYSGWGLTEDLAPDADRGRRLSLDELVAGTLILYPRYLDPVASKPCTPEHLLDRLSEARSQASASPLALGTVRHAVIRARYALVNPILRRLRARRGVRGGGEASR